MLSLGNHKYSIKEIELIFLCTYGGLTFNTCASSDQTFLGGCLGGADWLKAMSVESQMLSV